jgi:hypothetical protein
VTRSALITLATVVALAAHGSLATLAGAETLIELPKTKARLELPDAWKATPMPGLVAVYKDDRGAVLAVTRADVPNPDAWKSETKQAYADKVERGIRKGIAGYKRTSKKLATVGGVPALDVEATRTGGATVIVRVLLFRTYALSLAIEVPKGGNVAGARAIAQAFAPPPS